MSSLDVFFQFCVFFVVVVTEIFFFLMKFQFRK